MGTEKAINGKESIEILILKPSKVTNQAVIVVPMFAPKRIPADCVKLMSPALTKLTVITVVADDD